MFEIVKIGNHTCLHRDEGAERYSESLIIFFLSLVGRDFAHRYKEFHQRIR